MSDKSSTINYKERQKLLFVLIVIGAFIYGIGPYLKWVAKGTSAELIDLSHNDVSEIRIYNSSSDIETELPLLVTFAYPKDEKIIFEFVEAINRASQAEPPARQLILSHELLLVIHLKNEKVIEAQLHLHDNCSKAVYIDIIKGFNGKILSSIIYVGGAKSDNFLYEWLQELKLIEYLGCK